MEEPFCMLLHYNNEILQRCNRLKQSTSITDKVDEGELITQYEHLSYLSHFVSQRYDDSLRREIARHQAARPMCTYDLVWLLFRPGTVVYAWSDGTLLAYVVQSHSRETKSGKDEKIRPPTVSTLEDLERKKRDDALSIRLWYLDFDGQTIGRRLVDIKIPSFDGEKPILSLPIFPKEYLKRDIAVDGELSIEEKLIRRGKLFFEMTRRSYMQYDGKALYFPNRTVGLMTPTNPETK